MEFYLKFRADFQSLRAPQISVSFSRVPPVACSAITTRTEETSKKIILATGRTSLDTDQRNRLITTTTLHYILRSCVSFQSNSFIQHVPTYIYRYNGRNLICSQISYAPGPEDRFKILLYLKNTRVVMNIFIISVTKEYILFAKKSETYSSRNSKLEAGDAVYFIH